MCVCVQSIVYKVASTSGALGLSEDRKPCINATGYLTFAIFRVLFMRKPRSQRAEPISTLNEQLRGGNPAS